ncbi:protein phosphatase 1 regulatory subunit 32 [Biomphalaria pfeifferi]|uniref:Protein phosphatase 1 regulatory subunit 32 n=1 Tax=Biomphalaria pfeifferi TaxID=112525 RepID=A0AAD8AUE5_BIOPF|nr:protein phosphatase 1 regulatory subunit 32 [Biomphalaria pfeifferi]
MSKLPTGPRNAHIQKSQGADTNIMKFYITQNSSTYGARFDKFQPHQGHHRGTGYLSNLRPGVYYNRRLDDVDNPALRRICDGNYRSVTQLDFQPYRDPSGLEVFPNGVHHSPSAFVRQKALTVPRNTEVHSHFIDTKLASAPANILPKHKPLLHKLQVKDAVESENFGYGPRYMKTESQEKFKPFSYGNVDFSLQDIGPQSEVSGFVHNINDEPITYEPKTAFVNDKPGWYTHRPTGVSVTRTSFIPKRWPRGDDPLPGGVTHGSERDSGFTREEVKPKYTNSNAPDAYDRLVDVPNLKADRTRKNDPAEFINMEKPHNKTSLTGEQFKGQYQPAPTEADRLNRTKVGFKEDTSYTHNNIPFVQTEDNKMRFMTHYMSRFGPDPTPVGVDRAGHLRGGVQDPRSDGFTKSNTINSFGNEPPSSYILRRIEPYVGRSIRARNQFYDDHTYDSKAHTEVVSC